MTKKTKEAPAQRQAGRTVAEFRAAHDKSFIVPTKLKAALTAIGDGWVYEAELVKLAQISLTELGMYRGQFEEHIVTLKGSEHGGKRAWAGTKATAQKLRDMVR